MKSKEEVTKKVMNLISNRILEKNKMEHNDRIEKVMKEHGSRLLEPDDFHILVQFPEEEFQEALVEVAVRSEMIANGEEYNEDAIESIRSVYLNAHLFETQLDELIDKQEGMACSTDKARFLMRSYIQYLKTGSMPVFDRTKFWVPNFGKEDLWMTFIEKIPNLVTHGTDYYLSSRAKLLKGIETDKKDFTSKQEKRFKEHANFISSKVKSDRIIYTFQATEQEIVQHLELHITFFGSNRYSWVENKLNTNEWKRPARDIEKPDWVEELLKEL